MGAYRRENPREERGAPRVECQESRSSAEKKRSGGKRKNKKKSPRLGISRGKTPLNHITYRLSRGEGGTGGREEEEKKGKDQEKNARNSQQIIERLGCANVAKRLQLASTINKKKEEIKSSTKEGDE